MHRHFSNAESRVLDLFHHFDADDAAAFLQIDPFEDRAAHQAEIAIDVAQLEAEQNADDVVIQAADDDAVQRIGAADLVTVHQIDARSHAVPQRRQFGGIVLRVAVSIENELLGRRAEAGLQRCPVVAVRRMVHRAHLPVGARQFVGDFSGTIRASIVDNDDLEVRCQLRRGLDRADHHAGDGAAVVVGREEDTQTRGFAGRRG